MKHRFTLPVVIAATAAGAAISQAQDATPIKHVLLVSIDGMHAVDYRNCTKGISGINAGSTYCPNIQQLGVDSSIIYVNASTSRPSDSFPGLEAIMTGATPRTMGIYYDVAYDRSLQPPTITTGNGLAGGSCSSGQTPTGTTTEYEEGIDIDQTKLNGGAPGAGLTDGGVASINTKRLVRNPANDCNPVMPWEFVRVNSIMQVIHAAGGYTAWSDKHPAYSSVASGPGGISNLDDFYAPEINSDVVAIPSLTTVVGDNCAKPDTVSDTTAWTNSFQNIRCYDQLKANAVLNWIDGLDHNGKTAKVPTIFGMNFQAVSVGQKLVDKTTGQTGGYLNSTGAPGAALLSEIKFVDAAIGSWVKELKAKGLYDSTLIIITAKHGQSPIDPKKYVPILNSGTSPATLLANLLPESESPNNPTGIGPTEDDVSLLWLADSANTTSAVATLEDNLTNAGIGQIFSGLGLSLYYNAPGLGPNEDPRTPDIIVTPNPGVVYTGSTKKLAEHGGFGHDDTNVMLLVRYPGATPRAIYQDVDTAQIAPTILKVLGINTNALQGVQMEGTQVLPLF